MKIGANMNDDENLKYLVDMAQSLAGINGKMTMLCNMIAAHETRIQHLEDKQSSQPDSQNTVLAIALKALLFIAATAMALAGAGKFINV